MSVCMYVCMSVCLSLSLWLYNDRTTTKKNDNNIVNVFALVVFIHIQFFGQITNIASPSLQEYISKYVPTSGSHQIRSGFLLQARPNVSSGLWQIIRQEGIAPSQRIFFYISLKNVLNNLINLFNLSIRPRKICGIGVHCAWIEILYITHGSWCLVVQNHLHLSQIDRDTLGWYYIAYKSTCSI